MKIFEEGSLYHALQAMNDSNKETLKNYEECNGVKYTDCKFTINNCFDGIYDLSSKGDKNNILRGTIYDLASEIINSWATSEYLFYVTNLSKFKKEINATDNQVQIDIKHQLDQVLATYGG